MINQKYESKIKNQIIMLEIWIINSYTHVIRQLISKEYT